MGRDEIFEYIKENSSMENKLTTKEIARAIGINMSSCGRCLRRLRTDEDVKYGWITPNEYIYWTE